MGRARSNPALAFRRAFTLTELLVGVLILIVLIAAVGRIFGQFSRAASMGEANAAVIQQAVAIEKRIRDDVAAITREGPLAIRCVEVRNDINRLLPSSLGGAASAPLLDPTLPAEARLRCDQIVFFSAMREGSQRFAGSYDLAQGGGDSYGNYQATLARIYLGHGIQMIADPGSLPGGATGADRPSYDPEGFDWGLPFPWTYDAGTGDLDIRRWPEETVVGQKIVGMQPAAAQWILARQAVLCVDDMARGDYYSAVPSELAGGLDPHLKNSAPTWDTRSIWNGRVDICAEGTAELRDGWLGSGVAATFRRLLGNPSLPNGSMSDLAELRWVRAERTTPTTDDEDQMLSASTLAPNCSSFEIDWTWVNGTGEQVTDGPTPAWESAWIDGGAAGGTPDGIAGNAGDANAELRGWIRNPFDPDAPNALLPVRMTTPALQAWFGLPAYGITVAGGILDPDPTSDQSPPDKGVRTLATADLDGLQPPAGNGLSGPGLGQVWPPIDPSQMESYSELRATGPSGANIAILRVASYFFGVNTSEPVVTDASGGPMVNPVPFTPFPSALRISMRLHDPDGRLEDGRTYQFVVDLPREDRP